MPHSRCIFSAARCFKRISRRSIDNYPPLAEYHMESLRACADYCVMAAGNDRISGALVPAILHPAIGIDFYKRVGDDDGQGKQIAYSLSNNSRPKISPFLIFSTLLKNKSNQQYNHHSYPQRSPIDWVGRRCPSPRTPGAPHQDYVVKIRNHPATCLTSTGYYVVIGNEIVRPANNEGAVKVFNDVNQGDCAKFCSSNEGPNQEQLVCYSLNYFPMTKKCELYSILAEPHGPGSLVENQDVIYAEKFCLPRSCQEDEVFILHVQKSLTGIPTDQKPSQSITNCLQSCLNDDSCKVCSASCGLLKSVSVSKSQDSIVETPKQRGREAEKMPLEVNIRPSLHGAIDKQWKNSFVIIS
ncbi:unnamed protein product [Heligmosomoides polygyrus]|uniref:Apple domain-containing protein n=1 Tax=Heligmosomoides polygyrus TaxID=6339 RepID=A0A3P7YEL9_HELPZ|nr:unnamed protein product [Heligmosomoides polygyrus]